MKVYCTAALDNEQQIMNLCQCIEILGGIPRVNRGEVCVDYEGPKDKAEKFIELFEHYSRHGISTIED